MLFTIILIIAFFALMLVLGSGLWATTWPWSSAERRYPRDCDDADNGLEDYLL